ncbi:MAG: sigma-54 dependent transcriptional regulator [Bacteroidetes bacterium]|nr:sigma-54 dependent transcriptional regulator [Bacteroidota bacterium]
MSKKILFVDDDSNLLTLLTHTFNKYGYTTLGVQNPRRLMDEIASFYPHIICMDISMPEIDGISLLKEVKQTFPQIPVIMVTASNNVDYAIESLRSGAYHYIKKPINREELFKTVEQALEVRNLKVEISQFKRQVRSDFNLDSLVGKSPVFDKLRDQLQKLANVPEAPVLITGETGTGKSFLAKILHYITPETSGHSFVEVNSGAIPGTIFESELFGYMKGSFTDAKKDKIGLVEEAQDGTLFLDEIDSVPLQTQAKLLSFLESKKARRIGGLKEVSITTRVVVATNANLEEYCHNGLFREDLYYRINVINLKMPALREIPFDIPLIAEKILEEAAVRFGKGDAKIREDAAELLTRYHFPGNVRELRNILERALIFCSDGVIKPEDLNLSFSSSKKSDSMIFGIGRVVDLEGLEKEYIQYILKYHAKSYQEAADVLNISTKNLWEKRKKYDLGE